MPLAQKTSVIQIYCIDNKNPHNTLITKISITKIAVDISTGGNLLMIRIFKD